MIHIWAGIEMMLPPPEHQHPLEEIPDHPRTFHLVLKPRVSSIAGSTSFGSHFSEDYGDDGRESCKHFTLGDCKRCDIQ
jgi:hypothetical protein